MQAAGQDVTFTPRRVGGLLRQRNFRLLWIGETVSAVGNAMATVGFRCWPLPCCGTTSPI